MNILSPFHSFTQQEFLKHALSIFHFQYRENEVYRCYCDYLNVQPDCIFSLEQIPFLPISFFKTHKVVTTHFNPQIVFSSSGTTGIRSSQHFIKDISLYRKSFESSFSYFYGNPNQYCFLALLPNYLEREGSSLIYMIDHFISHSPNSGYYLYNHEVLFSKLKQLQNEGQKTILFGVTYALLDFVSQFTIDFPELMVFETGGMKGKRKEMVKEELHSILKNGFGVNQIYSEYGMCELLSQAYSNGNNLFAPPPWMKALVRDEKNPLGASLTQTTGCLNIIDFANLYSCSFIATDDLVRLYSDGKFEILGRLDQAEIKGCNLLVM